MCITVFKKNFSVQTATPLDRSSEYFFNIYLTSKIWVFVGYWQVQFGICFCLANGFCVLQINCGNNLRELGIECRGDHRQNPYSWHATEVCPYSRRRQGTRCISSWIASWFDRVEINYLFVSDSLCHICRV